MYVFSEKLRCFSVRALGVSQMRVSNSDVYGELGGEREEKSND